MEFTQGVRFDTFGLSEATMRAIRNKHYEISTPVQAVILAPTRELALQITEEMREVAVCHEGVRLVCLYGGQPIGK